MKGKSVFSVNKIIKGLMAAGLICSVPVSAGNIANSVVVNDAFNVTSNDKQVINSVYQSTEKAQLVVEQAATTDILNVTDSQNKDKLFENNSAGNDRYVNNKVSSIFDMPVKEQFDKETPTDIVEEELPTDIVDEVVEEQLPTDIVDEVVEEELPTDIVDEVVEEEASSTSELSYVVVDSMESECFDLDGEVIDCGTDLIGQDAEYLTTEASYEFYDADETTVLDNNTGLIWERSQSADQYVFNDASEYCESQTTGGYDEWRLPTIKELYSLADFDGDLNSLIPYIDTRYFDFEYASMAFATQFWSSTVYYINLVGGAPDSSDAYVPAFGFNFADGHIKSYGTEDSQPGLYIRCVMGDEDVYGVNDYALNDSGTIVTDNATGLMWQQADDGETYEWTDALDYCENLTLEGYDDWRLPDNKELQSIVKYGTTEVPAIDTDFFDSTFNESYGGGDFDGDYGWYWTSTTLKDFPANASYIAFGRAYSTTSDDLTDTSSYHDWHGAGAQRSDPKDGVVELDGDSCSITACDEERGSNYVRCVRGNAVAAEASDYDDYVSEATSSTTTDEEFGEELLDTEELDFDFESAVTYLETLGITTTADELATTITSLESTPPVASEIAEALDITEDEATELMTVIGFPTE